MCLLAGCESYSYVTENRIVQIDGDMQLNEKQKIAEAVIKRASEADILSTIANELPEGAQSLVQGLSVRTFVINSMNSEDSVSIQCTLKMTEKNDLTTKVLDSCQAFMEKTLADYLSEAKAT
jgi:hypothetical protein